MDSFGLLGNLKSTSYWLCIFPFSKDFMSTTSFAYQKINLICVIHLYMLGIMMTSKYPVVKALPFYKRFTTAAILCSMKERSLDMFSNSLSIEI